jgi:Ca2+/Na+ antiporter
MIMRLFLKSIPLFLLVALLASMFYWPNTTSWISIILLFISIGTALFLIFQKHRQSYQQAECTREKMVRNLGFDLLGLLLTLVTAMYCGQLAGGYFGLRAGFWIGLLAGFLGGFVAAWVVRSVWGKLVPST